MTVSTPDIQALIEEARDMADSFIMPPDAEPERLLILRMAAALSALSSLAETETEWAVRSEGDEEPWTDVSDDLGWLLSELPPFQREGDQVVSRRKAGPWIEVTK